MPEQNGKFEGSCFASSLSENAEQGSTSPMLLMEPALCRRAVGPGLWKFISDRSILTLFLLGMDMAESQWVIPSVPRSQDGFLPLIHNGFFNMTFSNYTMEICPASGEIFQLKRFMEAYRLGKNKTK